MKFGWWYNHRQFIILLFCLIYCFTSLYLCLSLFLKILQCHKKFLSNNILNTDDETPRKLHNSQWALHWQLYLQGLISSEREGFLIQINVYSDQEEETIQHILTTCVFARQFWRSVHSPLNLQQLVPKRREHSFATWWRKITKRVGKQHGKGLNALIILDTWTIWKHRNACVFDGDSPSISTSVRNLQLEGHLWVLAGARNLQNLELGHLCYRSSAIA